MERQKYLRVTFMFVLLLILFSNISNADMGPKPSITINLKNMVGDDYLIDLLVYDKDGKSYSSPIDYNGKGENYDEARRINNLETITIQELKMLHRINYNGWIAVGTRWNCNLVFSDCKGNNEHTHEFSYIGTPDTFRVVIIDEKTGLTKVTDVIHKEHYKETITLDVNGMRILQVGSIKSFLLSLLLTEVCTIIIEMSFAILVHLKQHYKIIIWTNLISNLCLHIGLLVVPFSYYISFAILEIVIIIAEFIIYNKSMKNETIKHKLTYTIIANLLSGVIIPLMFFLTEYFLYYFGIINSHFLI